MCMALVIAQHAIIIIIIIIIDIRLRILPDRRPENVYDAFVKRTSVQYIILFSLSANYVVQSRQDTFA